MHDSLWATVRSDNSPDRPAAVPFEEYAAWLRFEWSSLLESAGDEKVVQHFLERNPCLLPGGLPVVGQGHHGAWYDAVITQPALVSARANRVPDFLWLTRDTATNYVVCIEIERPNRDWFTLDGQPTAALTHALDQINEWRAWFHTKGNEEQFNLAYVPEDVRHRFLVPRFILIYGRDAEFRPRTSRHRNPQWLRSKRSSLAPDDVCVMTFDALRPFYDLQHMVTIRGRLPRFDIVAVPPTFHTGPSMSLELLASVSRPGEALAAVPLITDQRRAYLAARWAYWQRLGAAGWRETSQSE